MYIFKPKYLSSKTKTYIESKNWAVHFQHQGKRIVKSLGTNIKSLAQQRAKIIIEETQQSGWDAICPRLPGKNKGYKIDDLIPVYMDYAILRGLSEKTVKNNVYWLNKWKSHIGAEYISELSVEAFLKTDYLRDMNPTSRASALRQPLSVFSDEAMRYYREKHIMITAPDAKRHLWRKVHTQTFVAPSKDTIIALIRAARTELYDSEPELWLMFSIGICAGLRLSEINFLKWGDIKPGNIFVRSDETHKTKSGKDRVIPIPESLFNELEPLRGPAGGFVIAKKRTLNEKQLSKWLRAKGVDDYKPVHYLRKLYGSLVATEHGIYTAKEYLGHSTVQTTETYYANLLHKKTVSWQE